MGGDRNGDEEEGTVRTRRRPSKTSVAILLAVLAIGLIIVFVDHGDVWRSVRAADVEWMGFAVGASALAYAFTAASFAWIFRHMGIRMGPRRVMLVGYTSSALTHLMPMPAVAGHGIRMALMRDEGVSAGDSLAASAFHTYLTSFVLLLLFPAGLLTLVFNQELPDAARAPLATLAALALLLLGMMSWILFHAHLRRAMLRRLARLLGRLFRGDSVQGNIDDFDKTIGRGIRLLQKRKGAIAVAVALDLADWVFSAATLYFCFLAFGLQIGPGVLLTGFVVGIVVGLQSFVPGGIGIQEASMAGVFALLGVSFATAIVAALLFRVVYHILPFVVAVGTYGRLMRRPLRLEDLRRAPQAEDA